MSDLFCPVPRCGKRMQTAHTGKPKGVCCASCYRKLGELRWSNPSIPPARMLTLRELGDLLYPVAPVTPAEPADNDRAQVEALGVLSPQPPPTNTEGDVWQELIDITAEGPIRNLMIERRAQGIAKYGRPLGRDNGRDHNADAIQEAVDGMVYAHADRNEDARVAFTDTLRILLGEVSPSAAGWVHRSDYLRQEARAAAYAEVLARYGSDTGPAGIEALWAEGQAHKEAAQKEEDKLGVMRDSRNHWRLRAETAEAMLAAPIRIHAPPSDPAELAEVASEAHRKDRDYWRARADAIEIQHAQRLDELEKACILVRQLCDAIGCGDVGDEELLANVRHLADSFREQKGPGGLDALRKRVALRAAEGLVGDNSAALLDIIRDMLGVPDGR